MSSCDAATCARSTELRVSEKSGYLSSEQASDSGCGTARCPWHIDLSAGQRVNLSLFDFGPAAPAAGDPCHWYFVINDGTVTKEITRCQDNRRRFEHIYTSLSNALTIELFQFESKDVAPNFVIQYEGMFSHMYVNVHACTLLRVFRLFAFTYTASANLLR